MLKRIASLLLIAVIAGGAIYWTSGQQAQKQAGGGRRAKGGDEAVPVIVATARSGAFDVTLEGVGTARARNTVTVKPQVDGKILSIHFREGQDVKKGDLLAKIDPATYQAQLDQALAKKTVDESLLANAKVDLARYDKVPTGVVAQKTTDTQRALVAQLTAQLKSDDAAIASAKAVLDYTTILAPMDGRTGLRLVDEGNLVRSGDAGIVTITQVKPIAVLFTLPQQALGRINTAAAKGKLEAVALAPDGKSALDTGEMQVVDNQVDQTTGTIKLKAEFPNAQLQLWPGQFVNVRLKLETLPNVVMVPTPSIQRGPSGTFVYVVGADETAAMRPVRIAQQTEADAVIESGLAAGDVVVTAGFGRLQQGAKVSISKPDEPKPGKGPGRAETSALPDAPTVAPGEAQAQPAPAAADKRGDGTKRGEGKRRKREAASTP